MKSLILSAVFACVCLAGSFAEAGPYGPGYYPPPRPYAGNPYGNPYYRPYNPYYGPRPPYYRSPYNNPYYRPYNPGPRFYFGGPNGSIIIR